MSSASSYISKQYAGLYDLSSWASNPEVTGNKEEAAKKIEDAYNNGSRTLDLSHLKLTSLPECILNLRHVEVLALDWNEFSTLPAWLGNFNKLTHLFVQYNKKLTDLPESLSTSLTLRSISIEGSGVPIDNENVQKIFQAAIENSKK